MELLGKKVHQIARLGVGRTFQTASVFEQLTVLQNLDIAAGAGRRCGRCCGGGRACCRPSRRPWRSPDWPTWRDKPAGVLAHGQKQWLEIGMLLVQNADVLLLDEPVAGMSHEEREETGNLLRRIGGERTVVVVEHDMDFMRAFATSVTVLARGQVIAEGTVAEVQADPKVQEVYLGTAAAGPEGVPDELIEEALVLELVDVRTGYGRTEVIHGVTIEVPSDGVAAVMGHNGAGKTTLLRAAVGLLKCIGRQGGLRRRGRHQDCAPSARVARGTGLRAAGSAVVRSADDRGEPAGGRRRPQERQAADRRATRPVPGAKELLTRRAGLLSGGQRQQLAIARALITDAEVPDSRRTDGRHPAVRGRRDRGAPSPG